MKTTLSNIFSNGAILLVALYLPGWTTGLAICLALFFSLSPICMVLLRRYNPVELAKLHDKLKIHSVLAYDGRLELIVLDFFIDVAFLVCLAVLGSWPLFFVMLYGHGSGWYSYYKAATSVTRER